MCFQSRERPGAASFCLACAPFRSRSSGVGGGGYFCGGESGFSEMVIVGDLILVVNGFEKCDDVIEFKV